MEAALRKSGGGEPKTKSTKEEVLSDYGKINTSLRSFLFFSFLSVYDRGTVRDAYVCGFGCVHVFVSLL